MGSRRSTASLSPPIIMTVAALQTPHPPLVPTSTVVDAFVAQAGAAATIVAEIGVATVDDGVTGREDAQRARRPPCR